MSDLTQDLIHIAVGHLLPANPKKYAWVSAVETGPYHIETNDSAANGGQGFKAICGAAGDFNFHKTAGQIFPSQKCKACVELATDASTGNILEVARGGKNDRDDCIGVLPCAAEMEKESQANAGSSRRGISPATPEICADHAEATRQVNPGLCVRQLREDGQIDVADLEAGNAPVTDGLRVGDEGVSDGCEQMRALQTEQGQDLTANGGRNQFARSCENTADSQINQGLTIERLIDSAIRAEEHAAEIEQYRAEEEAAAEEGALIDASNMPYPEFERNGR